MSEEEEAGLKRIEIEKQVTRVSGTSYGTVITRPELEELNLSDGDSIIIRKKGVKPPAPTIPNRGPIESIPLVKNCLNQKREILMAEKYKIEVLIAARKKYVDGYVRQLASDMRGPFDVEKARAHYYKEQLCSFPSQLEDLNKEIEHIDEYIKYLEG